MDESRPEEGTTLADTARRRGPRGPVVVGFDDSPEAASALQWAADWSDLWEAPLVVVCAASPPPPLPWTPVAGTPAPDVLRRAARHVASRGAAEARRRHPQLEIRDLGAVGSPAAELVAMSQSADLVVVGRRTPPGRPETSMGSVSFALGMHARCPVVVVLGPEPDVIGPDKPVVVGFDTSLPARRALQFAASAASVAGADLVVVSAWSGPRQEPWMADLWSDAGTAAARLSDDESGRADASVREARSLVESWHPEVSVVTRTPYGLPQQALLEEAREAGLLVVGSRGSGGFAGLELGSVSRSLLRHAEVSVAVVRDGGI